MNKNNFTVLLIRKVLYSMIFFFIKVFRPINKIIFKFRNNKIRVNEIYYCPVCKTYPKFYVPLNIYYYFKAKQYGYKYFNTGEMGAKKTFNCPNCFANDTERIIAYWIDENIKNNKILRNSKLIHFAPEKALSRKLYIDSEFFNYISADLYMKGVNYKVDIMNLPFENESFDCFICSHVLEHVENDDKAISELFRILNKNGFGILMAPISTAIEHTLEDPNIMTQEERWKYFGQNDHLRLYSHNDYVNKLEKYGFKVNQLGINYFGQEVFKSLSLKETGILYVVEK